MSPGPRGRSLTGDPFTDAMVPVALRAVGAVRDGDSAALRGALADAEELAGLWWPADGQRGLESLSVVLAAMVPYDSPPSLLLRWVAVELERARLLANGVSPEIADYLCDPPR